ncbi:hypothetical protein [Haliangium ochraceum]|uniref:Lipoprotein n=1 Tax=Haliangium ochraceum (strain DSM 14365 / JCM 11303 / SMP-2) TaxID=502025 RepID=D0LU05_HALO1|nr:hypothetical protein [Haliangium ochraceum]ACY17369.1 conserved hypothetical protein [Haliangium ochraceum DSM 14365]
MKRFTSIIVSLTAAAALTFTASCSKSEEEKMEDQTEEAAENVEEAAEDTAENVEEAAEDTAEEMEEAADEATDEH